VQQRDVTISLAAVFPILAILLAGLATRQAAVAPATIQDGATGVRRAILILAFCQIVWSFGGVVIRWSPLSSTTLITLALLSAGAGLALMTPRRRLTLPNRRLRAEAIGFGIANGATNALAGAATVMAGIGNAAFAFASLPFWLVLVARPLVGDRVPVRAVPALVIGASGITLLLLSGRGSDSGDQVFFGIALGVLAAMIGSVSALAGRRLAPHIGAEATAAWTMLTGGLMLAPLADWPSLGELYWWMAPVILVWTGMHFIIAPLLYNRAAVIAPAFVMAVATFVNPAVAPVWGAVFYGERVAPLAIGGLVLALSANILLLFVMHSAAARETSAVICSVETVPASARP
jgi:probable blue pigment (indigoidine) exporter